MPIPEADRLIVGGGEVNGHVGISREAIVRVVSQGI